MTMFMITMTMITMTMITMTMITMTMIKRLTHTLLPTLSRHYYDYVDVFVLVHFSALSFLRWVQR